MDSDTTTRVGDHARLLERFGDEGDILVGTQMVAKGLDFPTVTLVGAVAADLDLHVADYRAAERTFALLTQVCGRSGRARAGEAIVQTYSPDHFAIRFAAQHDYDGFAREELEERRALRWPPFSRVVADRRDRALAAAPSRSAIARLGRGPAARRPVRRARAGAVSGRPRQRGVALPHRRAHEGDRRAAGRDPRRHRARSPTRAPASGSTIAIDAIEAVL